MQTSPISKLKRMLHPLLVAILTLGCLSFVNLLHVRNYQLTESQSQYCKVTEGIPEVSNTWGGLGFTVACKTKDTF